MSCYYDKRFKLGHILVKKEGIVHSRVVTICVPLSHLLEGEKYGEVKFT